MLFPNAFPHEHTESGHWRKRIDGRVESLVAAIVPKQRSIGLTDIVMLPFWHFQPVGKVGVKSGQRAGVKVDHLALSATVEWWAEALAPATTGRVR